MIRLAEIKDLGAVVSFGEEVCKDTGFHSMYKYSPETFFDFAGRMIKADDQCILLAFCGDELVGMCGVTLGPIYFSGSNVLANCLFLWLRKGHRGNGLGRDLLRSSVEWGECRGATHHGVYVVPGEQSDSLSSMYRRNGYEPTEATYTKRIL